MSLSQRSKDWDIEKLTPEQGRLIVYGDTERFDVIEDKIIESHRWSILHSFVVEDTKTGKHYMDSYRVGATEYQDERPYDVHYPDFREVERVEVIAYEWKIKMRKLTGNDIKNISLLKHYHVRLTRLYEPKPKLIWEGKTQFHIQKRDNNEIGVLTPKFDQIPCSWAEYCEEDIRSDGSCVCEDYLMEIYI